MVFQQNRHLFQIYLPKWCHMVVVGESISTEQAAEILIRTADFTFTCNDTSWRSKLYSVLNIRFDRTKGYLGTDYSKIKEVEKSLNVLPLKLLQNYQIASNYIGGPHGWCNWDGTIGCHGYNIGNWPTVESVYNEWKLIAKTWPFLKLRCQLWNGENNIDYDSDDSLDNYIEQGPVVEFIIEKGCVSLAEPRVLKIDFNMMENKSFPIMGKPERGCTLQQFREAIDIVKK